MIMTVTPSPAIDWTVAVDSFALDAVNRITSSTREASGKGLNVSWALHRAGVETKAVFPGGGRGGQFMDEALTSAGMPFTRVDTGLDVRTNITMVSPGHSTKINEPGVDIENRHITSLIEYVVDDSRDVTDVLICGSLPPAFGGDHLQALISRVRAAGARVIVDTSGGALSWCLQAEPDLIKPNVHELAELVSRHIGTFADVVSAAWEVIGRGAGSVLASLGADGAMYIDAERALLARATNVPYINSVGAGDALLAGFVAADAGPADRLRNAVLWASSAVAHHTTLFPVRPEFQELISVVSFDGAEAVLSEPSHV